MDSAEENPSLLSDEYKKKVTLEEAKFIFSQAEKQLDLSINNSDVIITRTTVLITIVFALLSSLIGLAFSKYNSHNLDIQFILCTIMSIYYFGLLIFLSRNIRGFKYMASGSEPKDLLNEYYHTTFPDAKSREIQLLISEIEAYQVRIEDAKQINKKRWIEYKIATYMLLYSPILAVLLSGIIYFIRLLSYFLALGLSFV